LGERRVEQQHNRQRRHLEQLCKESFVCEADALKAIKEFEQTLHYCQLTAVSVVKTGVFKSEVKQELMAEDKILRKEASPRALSRITYGQSLSQAVNIDAKELA
jgi:hypothetical protein